jgi:hypothetical protein
VSKETKLYEIDNGKKVSIPEDNSPEDLLKDALVDNFSPGAIVAIASLIYDPKANIESINIEVRYLRDLLKSMVGNEEYNETLEVLGL